MEFSSAAHSVKISRGYPVAITATLLLSITGILISYLNRTYALPSLVLAFWRAVFVSVGMLAGLSILRPSLLRLYHRHFVFILFYGLTVAAFNSTWTLSVQFNGAALATVLAYSSPAITAILSRWVFKEEITRFKILSIVLSLSGTALVAGAWDAAAWRLNPAGIIFGLSSGFLYAMYSLFGKSASDRSINAWTTLLYSFCAGSFFLLLINLVVNSVSGAGVFDNFLWLGKSMQGWGILIFLAIGPTIGGFGLYIRSLGYLPATVVTLIAALEPALTAIWAFLLFNERMTGLQLFGGALVLMGVVILRVKDR